MSLQEIVNRHNKYQDAMLEAFDQHLSDIIDKAEIATLGALVKKLAIQNGEITSSPGNLRVMRALDSMFMDALEDAGYSRLLNAFAGEFAGQLPYLQETLDYLSDQMKTPLPKLEWSATDLKVLDGFRQSSIEGIRGAIEAAAVVARNRVMLSIGGLEFKELVGTLKEAFGVSLARAKTLAETSQTMFYRTATDRAFEQIEKELPKQIQRYRYYGPNDARTRIFCEQQLTRTAKRGMTRDEIDQLNNGQIPNVMISCGGFACRHSWLLDTREIEAKFLKAA